ncbi:MAG TPA: hypothetical protein VGM27_28480, partial [Acidobacteriaceae bacterium]
PSLKPFTSVGALGFSTSANGEHTLSIWHAHTRSALLRLRMISLVQFPNRLARTYAGGYAN